MSEADKKVQDTALLAQILGAMQEAAELSEESLGSAIESLASRLQAGPAVEGTQLATVDTQVLELPLLETGLDSIGFATVVALLEDKLGFDPFLMTDEPIYPTTLGEFLAVYENAEVE